MQSMLKYAECMHQVRFISYRHNQVTSQFKSSAVLFFPQQTPSPISNFLRYAKTLKISLNFWSAIPLGRPLAIIWFSFNTEGSFMSGRRPMMMHRLKSHQRDDIKSLTEYFSWVKLQSRRSIRSVSDHPIQSKLHICIRLNWDAKFYVCGIL